MHERNAYEWKRKKKCSGKTKDSEVLMRKVDRVQKKNSHSIEKLNIENPIIQKEERTIGEHSLEGAC